MIVAARQHYRGFGVDPVTLALITALLKGGMELYGNYQKATEAEKVRAWQSLGASPEFRRRYEAIWAKQAAALAPPPVATSALPGWVWPAAGATVVLIVLGGIALALRRE